MHKEEPECAAAQIDSRQDVCGCMCVKAVRQIVFMSAGCACTRLFVWVQAVQQVVSTGIAGYTVSLRGPAGQLKGHEEAANN